MYIHAYGEVTFADNKCQDFGGAITSGENIYAYLYDNVQFTHNLAGVRTMLARASWCMRSFASTRIVEGSRNGFGLSKIYWSIRNRLLAELCVPQRISI